MKINGDKHQKFRMAYLEKDKHLKKHHKHHHPGKINARMQKIQSIFFDIQTLIKSFPHINFKIAVLNT